MALYDISVYMTSDMPHWPDEKGFSCSGSRRDDGVLVSEIGLGLHTGTHLDAPSHFLTGGKAIDGIAPEQCCGPARVVSIGSVPVISESVLRGLDLEGCRRVLFQSDNHRLWSKREFDPDFTALDLSGAAYLAGLGMELIGCDYLSVEGFHSDGSVHRMLLDADILLLEGLNLAGVPAGEYILIALPLKMKDVEASPVRAVLCTQDHFGDFNF